MQIVNSPRDYVRALTCGVAKRDLERRVLVMLRAFVDDSGSSGREGIFVLGGLVAFANKWEDFIDPWDRALRSGVRVPFFRQASFRDSKWRDDNHLSPEAAAEKMDELASLVKYPPLLFSVCCTVQKKDYREIVTNSGVSRKTGKLGKLWLTTPYAYCFHNLIALTLEKIVDKLGIRGDVVDFVFDRNDGVFDAANAMLRELRRTMDNESWRNTLGDAIPGDDEKLIPLQAADLLAGRLKDHCSASRDVSIKAALLDVSGTDDHNITRHIRPPRLNRLVASIQQGRQWS